jgi:hypothetical protein
MWQDTNASEDPAASIFRVKMEAAGSSKTWAPHRNTIQHYNPEDLKVNNGFLTVTCFKSEGHAASIFILEAEWLSKTLVSYITTWCHNSENHDLNIYRCENLKPHISNICLQHFPSKHSYFKDIIKILTS